MARGGSAVGVLLKGVAAGVRSVTMSNQRGTNPLILGSLPSSGAAEKPFEARIRVTERRNWQFSPKTLAE